MLPSTLRANWLPGICRSKVSHLFFPSCTEIKQFIYHNNPTKRLKRSTQQLYDCFLFTHRHSCTSRTGQTPSFQTWFQLLLFHFSVHVVAHWVMWYPLHPTPILCIVVVVFLKLEMRISLAEKRMKTLTATNPCEMQSGSVLECFHESALKLV